MTDVPIQNSKRNVRRGILFGLALNVCMIALCFQHYFLVSRLNQSPIATGVTMPVDRLHLPLKEDTLIALLSEQGAMMQEIVKLGVDFSATITVLLVMLFTINILSIFAR